ncbi:DinB family protein [Ureibacillus xyleni]|uniref:DinB family protein n=1 Tax=Ureibacillus xyleni TaxID=614648 RepID=A0A285T9G3_9BACL|nr:putative metal-dependent hydrolase [Ureibacillus xyleni]SOC18074.1 DinB family protein [Ureibacillus xyleni]
MDNIKYPIGQFEVPEDITEKQLNKWISEISTFPLVLNKVVGNLNEVEQQLTYRQGAWTIKQLVHHIADAQINYYTRIKLALTEDNPTIKPFEENEWASLVDSDVPLLASIKIIEGINERFSFLLEHLTEEQLNKFFSHPVTGKQTIPTTIGFCSWHIHHHLAHIKLALENK